MLYFIFQFTGAAHRAACAATHFEARGLPQGYSLETWQPRWKSFIPPTLSLKFIFWWLLHVCGIFRNHGYSVLIVRRNGRAVHRTCIIPKYFRWPFMSDRDLQVSSTWTHPDHRCLGLATAVLQFALAEWGRERRTLWYVTHAENAASLAVCRKAGFRLRALGQRTSRFGIRLLGQLAPLDGSRAPEPSCGILSPHSGSK